MTASRRLQLQNGGTIAVEEYGAADGYPVFFFHGWPSSRTMAQLTDEAARELGLRILAPDRPGIRDSSFQAARTLADWPPVLREIAAQLGLKKFRVLGISGGAPYVYAAGAQLSDQVEAIAVVSGAPPIAELDDLSDLLLLYRLMLGLHKRAPRLLRAGFHVARPIACLPVPLRLRPLMIKIFQHNDAEVMRDARAFDTCYESARQAWRSSALGIMIDAEIYAKPWGFTLEDVRVPARLWHGRNDRAFSPRLAQKIATRLPECRFRLLENEGHFSLPIRHIREILADLIA